MIFPLEDLSKFKGGMYAITVAASRRAYQLAKLAKYNDSLVQEELEENDGKVVSLAARQLFSGDVKFSIEEKNRQMNKVVVVFAPTACGKTALARKIFGKSSLSCFKGMGEVISADSQAVYKGFDIGT